MNQLLPVYESLLNFAGLAVDGDGYVDIVLNGAKEPCLIDGKRLVLPTEHHLRNPAPDDKLIFHPAAENILRKKSAVIEYLTRCINVKLNYSFGFIARGLLQLANSPALHPELSPEQLAGVIAIGEVDDTTLRNFVSLMTSGFKKHADRLFVNIYLNPGGSINGVRYARCGISTFSFYEKVAEKGDWPAEWPKARVKDKAAYKKLIAFMLPNIDAPEEYQYGSNSTIAPFLDALMRTAALVASQLNWQAGLYESYIEDTEHLTFDMDWVEAFDDLRSLSTAIRAIPPQAGNDGPPQTQPAAPMPPPPPVPYGYPQPPYGGQPQRPEIKMTKRGIDYQSLRNAMPDLQRAPNPLQNQLWQQYYAETQRAAMANGQYPVQAWGAPPQYAYAQNPWQAPYPQQTPYPQQQANPWNAPMECVTI